MFNVTVIGTLGGPNSRAFAINLGRQLAGDSNAPPNSDNHTMFFDGGSQDLGVLALANPFGLPTIPIFNLSTSRALGAFPAGAPIVAGFSSVASFPSGVISRATFWANNTINDMGTLIPGPAFPGMFLGTSEAHGANNQGLIVGVSEIAVPLGTPALERGFVFDASTLQMQMLPTLSPDPAAPGQFLGNSKALGINDLGQIVGLADTDLTDPTGNPIRHAFLFDMRTQQIQDLGTLISRLLDHRGRTRTARRGRSTTVARSSESPTASTCAARLSSARFSSIPPASRAGPRWISARWIPPTALAPSSAISAAARPMPSTAGGRSSAARTSVKSTPMESPSAMDSCSMAHPTSKTSTQRRCRSALR
jgi:probable HAF family extracellular repeat protein